MAVVVKRSDVMDFTITPGFDPRLGAQKNLTPSRPCVENQQNKGFGRVSTGVEGQPNNQAQWRETIMELTPFDRMRLLNEARGLLPQDELERRARLILDAPVIPAKTSKEPDSPRLIISDFLRSKGFEPMKKSALHFGSRLAENYKMKFGAYPPKHGKTYIYYEIDRPLMEETWAQIQTEDAD